MRYWIIGILLVVVLAACSSPVAPPPEPSEVGSPSAEPTEVISPPVEPTSEPTSGSAAPLLDEEIIHMHPSEVDNTTLPITAVKDLHRTAPPKTTTSTPIVWWWTAWWRAP